jgi:two-component system sensor histidine kinase ChvG
MRRRRNQVEVLVEDSGPGIEPDALDRIFERFYTDRPEQGFGQNSGLGLSISRQIIEAHRGTIRAENRLGSPDETGEPKRLGARFVIRLPVEGAKGRREPGKKEQSSRAQGKQP